MNVEIRRSKYLTRLLVLVVATATTFILVIQYQWFDSAADMRVKEAWRQEVLKVYQTVSREYDRYLPLLADFKRLGETREPEDLEAAMGQFYRVWGGGQKGFIRGLVLFEPGGIKVQGDLKTDVLDPLNPLGELPGHLDRALSDGVAVLFPTRPEGQLWPMTLVRRPDARRTLVLVLDFDGFYEGYLKPVLSQAWPGQEFRRLSTQDLKPRQLRLGMQPDYHFNPFRAILGLGSEGELLVRMPVFRDNPYLPQDWPVSLQGFRSFGVPSQDTEVLVDRPRGRDGSDWYLLLKDPRGGSVSRIEGEMALMWLALSVLVLMVGSGFVVLLLQVRRLRSIRHQEREFVAAFTHELRTPLTVMESVGDNLATGRMDPGRVVEYGQLICEHSRRLGRMISEVLDFSRVEGAGSLPAVVERVDREELLLGIGEVLGPLTESRGLTLVQDTLGLPATLDLDTRLLMLVVENLVANAVHHAYGGKNTGEIRLSIRWGSPRWVLVTVEDDGRGIAPRESRLVFQAFYRDSQSRALQERGSGLGLYLVARRLRAAGGSITLESPYRRIDGRRMPGCRFEARLPVGGLENG